MTSDSTLLEAIDVELQHRQATRRVQRLADALITVARIPEGTQLVALVGTGDERSNRDAICNWVHGELKNVNLDGIDPLDYLYARLQQCLAQWAEELDPFQRT